MLMVSSGYGIDENALDICGPILEGRGVSVRSAGMGGVSAAVSSGVDGLYSNPATLTGLKSKEVLFMHHRWLREVRR